MFVDRPRIVPTRTGQAGFSLLELMIVVTIAGILAMLIEPSYQASVVKAREAALKQNLLTLRDVLDQHRADKGRYPNALTELISAGYLKRIPVDPITHSMETWQEIPDEEVGGIFDIHSGSPLLARDGTPYNEW
ncbi:MAG: prepilin-type N-terminal cleavage/methylation domain-containing protein [Nitrospira sp.]|nr:prepilin-type N-terminal cleavage/methylation domain-containing protein [Nitrospira sp.]